MSAQQDDYLGYKVYAQTLWARIARALPKPDEKLGDDPLVVGIFGEWGAGKSKLLNLIHDLAKAELEQQQKQDANAPLHLTIPVLFQPWKYEHEPHLHVPLVMHIAQALKEALKGHQGISHALTTQATQLAEKGSKQFSLVNKAASAAVSLFEPLKKVLAGLSIFGSSIDLPEEVGQWLEDIESITDGSPEALKALEDRKKTKAEKLTKQQIVYSADGLYFYRINEFLRKITQPGSDKEIKQQTNADAISKDTRINFVIFIDDLDRCLPEKAVEALELIKTVFNLESFAFVLALDEEVVERGIGHRYRDYNFKDKKPEMPITGFEYLEKIVHLPFRLPALTREQAYRFLFHYEQDTLLAAYKTNQYKPKQWMIPIQQKQITLRSKQDTRETQRVYTQLEFEGDMNEQESDTPRFHTHIKIIHLNLASLILESFTAYVPRKLIRALELFHQVLRVLQQDGRIAQVKIGGELDPRLLLAMVMIQLFQPELYRSLRREQGAFAQLWAGFEAPSDEAKSAYPNAIEMSSGFADADLLYWAVLFSGDKPPTSLAEAASQAAGLPDWKQRFIAQRQRLPIVQRLLEHRSIGRLAFDPLALMQVLRGSHVHVGLGSLARGFVVLSQVLDETQDDIKRSKANSGRSLIEVVLPAAPSASKPVAPWRSARPQSAVLDVNALFVALLSDQDSVQKEAAASAGLNGGQCLQIDSALRILQLLKTEKSSRKDTQNPAWQVRFMRGLQIVAPHVPDELAQDFWDLAKDDPAKDNFGKAFDTIDSLHATERWADVRSALGQDDRFDPQFYHLPKKHDNHGIAEISGFVKVDDFFMARYLTTVDQYACFIHDKGYEEKKYWDDLGWLWRTGDWDSQIKEKAYKEHLDRRSKDFRDKPMDWEDQLAHGSRPVMRLTWFEARAYCKWLSVQQGFSKYRAHLPTEAQSVRAAQADAQGKSDGREYPWGNNKTSVHLRANIGDSKIGQASAVGLFGGSPLGLYDLSGNVQEWLNTLYEGGAKRLDASMPDNVKTMKTHEKWGQSDTPALRGGSWTEAAIYARASTHEWYLPDLWTSYVGFRVVLSLALS